VELPIANVTIIIMKFRQFHVAAKNAQIFQVRCAWVRGSELALIFSRSDVDITRQHDWSALEMLTCIILKGEKLHP
jgi:hypothetical protein